MKILKFLFIMSIPAMLSSCGTKTDVVNQPEEAVTFVHTVFFWLNDSVSEADRADFEKGMVELGTIEVIKKYYYGEPALTNRDVVDNTYDYGWIVHFASAADEETYQNHPTHLAFIDKYKHLWKQVKVYDTLLK